MSEPADRVDERTRERDQLWAMSEDLLIVADLQGQVVKVSPSWVRLLGWTGKDLMDGGYAGIVHPDDLPTVMAAVQRMRDTRQTVGVEDRLRTRGGEWRWFSWKLSPEADGDRRAS